MKDNSNKGKGQDTENLPWGSKTDRETKHVREDDKKNPSGKMAKRIKK